MRERFTPVADDGFAGASQIAPTRFTKWKSISLLTTTFSMNSVLWAAYEIV
jgi:hypothetical protein